MPPSELDTVEIADKLDELAETAMMLMQAANGLHREHRDKAASGMQRQLYEMHDDLRELSAIICPQSEVEPSKLDVA
jgi:hypothetical protein